MMDMNTMISRNINEIMIEKGYKKVDLADAIGVTRQTLNKMLNGGRNVSAIELKLIADFLNVSMERLVESSQNEISHNPIMAFCGQVNTEEARRGVQMVDRIADLIIFHSTFRDNADVRMKEWNDE